MKTIFALSKTIEVLGEDVRDMKINGFEYVGGFRSRYGVKRGFVFSFQIECAPKHFQTLKSKGIKFDFSKIDKKSSGRNGNTILTIATAEISDLVNIEKYTRDNHICAVSITNDFQLAEAGWKFREKYSRSTVSASAAIFAKKIRSFTQKKIEAGKKQFGSSYQYPMTRLQEMAMAKIYTY